MRFPSPEFDDAVAAACQGTADEACLEALGALLAGSDAALDAYLRRIELHATLVSTPPFAVPALDAAPASPHASLRSHSGRAWAAALASAAALLVGGVWLGGAALRPLPWVGARAPAAPEAVGRFGGFEGVTWVRPDAEAGPGDRVRAGQRIEVSGGSLWIEFTSGAAVKLTGPAIFDIESPLAATLTMGRVDVTAATPESKGYTVGTRTGRIVDLGTQFTAEAGADGRCRVSVASGEVRFSLADSDVSHLLRAGGTMDVEPGRRQVVTRIERGDESAAFSFPSIEPPSADDLADASRGRATIHCVRGMLYENPSKQVRSAAPEILLDGNGQSGPDSPVESLYFADGEQGGLVLDLGAEVAVTKINVYSWHRCLDPGFPAAVRESHRERAAQHYAIYGRAGERVDAAGSVAAVAQPEAGWTLIARVNSDQHFGLAGSQRPGQQASSVTSARGPLGRFRYLMFVIEPTTGMNHDGKLLEFGTFCGEIDVYGE